MKTIPPPCPEPESGQRYWRSLDDLADRPEFRQWVEREFPAGADEMADAQTRRHFVKIMGASFLLGGMGLFGSGCRRPEERILPFSKLPEGYVHGVAQYFATAMPTRGSAIPLLVKSHDGRPTKVEGNPEHPDSNGGTDLHAQASILSLYDPDRAQRYARSGNTATKAEALDFLGQEATRLGQAQGRGLFFLCEQSSSPSLVRQKLLFALRYSNAKWAVHEPVDLHAGRQLTGAWPYYKVDKAKVILSLDSDFLGGEADAHQLIRGFARGRKISKPGDPMNRLYAVEGLMTLTGVNADHRLRVPTSQVAAVAAAIASKVAPANNDIKALADRLKLPAGVDARWIEECANDLLANRGASLVMAGHRQPLAVQVLANLLNAALGNNGATVFYAEIPQTQTNLDLAGLVAALNAGQVDTLVLLGGNPALTAPADLNFAAALAKANNVIRLGYYEDETFAAMSAMSTKATGATWHLPAAHYLESWGDARTADGTLVPIQPLIAPLFDGVTEIEVLARLAGSPITRPHDVVRDTLRQYAQSGNFEENWKKFLHDGFWPGRVLKDSDSPLIGGLVSSAFAALTPERNPAPAKDNLEVVFARDYAMDDGRWNNNGWLQELPNPITKTVWDGVVLLSRKTAEELGAADNDVLEIELKGRKVRGPARIQPGLADHTLVLSLGYGRKRTPKGGTGRVGHGVGLYNAYELRTTGAEQFASGARVRKTGEVHRVSCTQEHGSMEGRPIIREANKAQFEKHPKFAKNFDLESPHHSAHIAKDLKTGRPKGIYEHPYEGFEKRGGQSGVKLKGVFKSDVHQWGMSIDLTACVGCAACVIACQSENNVPIVGKDQVRRNREMHWLRLDRYYSGRREKAPADQIDNPQVVVQPMLCQHCENAPCESVCPVNATVHDEEGLNVMAYNRCVGTRYCSNNCPYKVRRFNYFDFNKRPLNDLYASPLTSFNDGEWELTRWWKNPDKSNRPEDEWELLKLARNPDVSVRMRGVMEKCTFCVQRIEGAKIQQKIKAGASGDVQVKDGAFKTACEQACPAEAIVFGNLLDPDSRVSKLKRQERDYEVLGFLETRPRLTYLARIRNPNPRMPDYAEHPLNTKEYMDEHHANPFEEHHASAAGHGDKKGAH
jgi:molybdopterin-containing oxidoreductase family iron-sulfur binding subunit